MIIITMGRLAWQSIEEQVAGHIASQSYKKSNTSNQFFRFSCTLNAISAHDLYINVVC